MRVGAHLSTAGGLTNALVKAQEIGANCLQIFSSPPQQWQSSRLSTEARTTFKLQAIKEDILPIFVHGTYLINLASENPYSIEKSKQSLIDDLSFCHDIGSIGVIFHFGSHPQGWKGKKTSLVPSILEILAKTPRDTYFIIENAAGTGTKIGAGLEELQEMKEDIADSRVRFCLDTAHALASGYEFRTQQSALEFVLHVDKTIGWSWVSAIHLNDSKVDIHMKNDRHENIGEGFIGFEGFSHLFAAMKPYDIPFILETPGFDGLGPDKENIDRVKILLK